MKIRSLLPLLAALLSSCAALSSSSLETVYIVEASGGAWSAGAKAREAMGSLEGLEELHMSGARAVFRPADGEEVEESELASAFEEVGMKLESFREVRRPRPERLYLVDAGITWATTAGKVREALLEETGALDVYFEDSIEILFADDPVDVEAISEVLDGKEVEYTTIQVSPLD